MENELIRGVNRFISRKRDGHKFSHLEILESSNPEKDTKKIHHVWRVVVRKWNGQEWLFDLSHSCKPMEDHKSFMSGLLIERLLELMDEGKLEKIIQDEDI